MPEQEICLLRPSAFYLENLGFPEFESSHLLDFSNKAQFSKSVASAIPPCPQDIETTETSQDLKLAAPPHTGSDRHSGAGEIRRHPLVYSSITHCDLQVPRGQPSAGHRKFSQVRPTTINDRTIP